MNKKEELKIWVSEASKIALPLIGVGIICYVAGQAYGKCECIGTLKEEFPEAAEFLVKSFMH